MKQLYLLSLLDLTLHFGGTRRAVDPNRTLFRIESGTKLFTDRPHNRSPSGP